jgi:hypothetical protein
LPLRNIAWSDEAAREITVGYQTRAGRADLGPGSVLAWSRAGPV